MASCQDNIDVVSFPTPDGNSFIGLEERGQVDTLILLPYSAKVFQQSIASDSIVLLLQTPRFYEYLLINRENQEWQVDSEKSGIIFSDMWSSARSRTDEVRDSKSRFSLTHSGVVEYVTDNNKKLRIPLRLIQKRNPSWLYTKDPQAPPMPPMPLFQLEFELEVDSLNINRNKRVKMMTSQLEKTCLPDSSSMLVIQFVIGLTGELSKFRVVKDFKPDHQLNEKTVACLEGVINELDLNFGELKFNSSARRAPMLMQYTIPLLIIERQ